MPNPALRHQSLGRPLTEAEVAFAAALEAVFADGHHVSGAAAAELQKRGIKRPSGDAAPWDAASLERELTALNAALDAAYSAHGTGA